MRFLILFVLLLGCAAFDIYDEVVCRHDEIHEMMTKDGILEERRHVVRYEDHPFERRSLGRRAAEGYEPLRIRLDSTQMDLDGLTPTQSSYVKNYVFPAAIEWIEKLLLVVPLTSDLEFPREESPAFQWCNERWGTDGDCKVTKSYTCNHIPVPKSFYTVKRVCPITEGECADEGGSGFANTDVTIFVSAQETAGICGPAESTLAYASTCVRDQHGRPIFGAANLCPDKIDASATSTLQIQRYVAIMVHEIFHALGFSYSSFSKFRYPDGSERSQVTQIFQERGHSVEKLITETALSVAREHFDCPGETLNGVEIEDGGGAGTAKSHPEMRIYQNDFMNGVIPSHPIYGDVTMAVMQDSGWYRANFSNTQRQFWGANAGCSFAMDNCLSDPKSAPVANSPANHFCTVPMQVRCTADRKSIGYCIMYDGVSIPAHYQYFSDSGSGGTETNDYCPIYHQVSISGTTKTTDCLEVGNIAEESQQFYGEEYGSSSACFENNLRNYEIAEYSDPEFLSGKCYRYQCIPGGVKIFIAGGRVGSSGDTSVTCTTALGEASQAVDVTGGDGAWTGSIICPKMETICPGPKPIFNCPQECQNNGTLADCVCTCEPGWGGLECQWYTCDDIPYTYTSTCGGHGVCVDTDVCNCTDEYTGQFCEFPYCFGEYDSDACSFPNGTCSEPDVCACVPGFIGQECEDDVRVCLEDPSEWDAFDGGSATRPGEGDCGVRAGRQMSIYFGGANTRKVVQNWKAAGNYSLRFWIVMGTGDVQCLANDGSTPADIVVTLEFKKSSSYWDETELLSISYDEYSTWSEIELPYVVHFPNRILIEQPAFVELRDQWSVDDIELAVFPYVPPVDDDPSYVPPDWYLDLWSWMQRNWPAAVGIGVGVGACVLCCVVVCTFWICCICRKKRQQRNKIHPTKRRRKR